MVSTALDKVIDFIFTGLVKFISRLPQSPFDYDSYFTSVSSVLQDLNYFVPFYLFSDIFVAWEAAFLSMFGIFMAYKFASKGRG